MKTKTPNQVTHAVKLITDTVSSVTTENMKLKRELILTRQKLQRTELYLRETMRQNQQLQETVTKYGEMLSNKNNSIIIEAE